MKKSNDDYWVQCNVCKHQLKNWTGSTPCCGSVAYLVNEDGTVSEKMSLFFSTAGEPIEPKIIDFEK